VAPEPIVRRARTADIPAVKALVDRFSGRILLEKTTVQLYEDVQDMLVAELDGRVVGSGALHVMWHDLAEVRSVVVEPEMRGRGVGHLLLEGLLDQARWLGVRRVFCLTFETAFFARHGFHEIEGAPVPQAVYEELRRSFDEGVAEFLDLERRKPNTLGNTRMLRLL
jgi:amino-acid N-acetyltransferase